MKTRKLFLPLALVATAGYGGYQDDKNAELEARIVELEQRVLSVENYLQAQAAATNALSSSLSQSEEAGFTYGINPESRKILLTAWRAQIAAAQKSVPGAPAEPAPATAPSPAPAPAPDPDAGKGIRRSQ